MTLLNAFAVSLAAALATGVGGAVVAIRGNLSMRAYDAQLGFAAGVMTAVATLGLIEKGTSSGGTAIGVLGVLIGAGALFVFDRYLPHQHVPVGCPDPAGYRRGMLLFSAMALHNVPEGLAVGTSYAAAPRLGLLLAAAIALHNIPEGIAVAGPFRACGLSRLRSAGWALASGLSEPVAALVGAAFVSAFQPLLPFSLCFAGGAMLYVVSDELIPESHAHGYEHEATVGFIGGFLLLLALLRLLG